MFQLHLYFLSGLPIADKSLEPKGTFGRVIAVIVRIIGLFWFILVLSAAKQTQKYDAAETQFFGWIRLSSLHTVVKISAARVIQYTWLNGAAHWSTLRQLDRFRLAQQNWRMIQKAEADEADFEVFKRSLSKKMSEMKKMVITAVEEIKTVEKEDGRGKRGIHTHTHTHTIEDCVVDDFKCACVCTVDVTHVQFMFVLHVLVYGSYSQQVT